VHTMTTPSLADGLTVPTVGINAFATGSPIIDKVTRSQLELRDEFRIFTFVQLSRGMKVICNFVPRQELYTVENP
jgi:hypothetical protein